MTDETSVRVLIADDQAMVRGSFRVLVDHTPGMIAVGEAENGREAVDLARHERPDVVLMDVRMPELDGIEATAAARLLGGQPRLHSACLGQQPSLIRLSGGGR